MRLSLVRPFRSITQRRRSPSQAANWTLTCRLLRRLLPPASSKRMQPTSLVSLSHSENIQLLRKTQMLDRKPPSTRWRYWTLAFSFAAACELKGI